MSKVKLSVVALTKAQLATLLNIGRHGPWAYRDRFSPVLRLMELEFITATDRYGTDSHFYQLAQKGRNWLMEKDLL